MTEYYIGLISGTSMDGVDAAIVDFADHACQLRAQHYEPMPATLKAALLSLCNADSIHMSELGILDIKLGQLFAHACQQLLQQAQLDKRDIIAIGSHGQTVCHYPDNNPAFTLQIADPNTIAANTGITTVADFRRRDMALGGQGAPLIPVFHQYLLHDQKKDCAIINIGGIANITLLYADPNQPIIGFDTGTGNVLLDSWSQQHLQQAYDNEGAWAATGKVHEDLLKILRQDPYFHKLAPKSSGREYFNLSWLNIYLQTFNTAIPAKDIQATLVALTANTIVDAVHQHLAPGNTVILHGGGCYNQYLRHSIQHLLGDYQLLDSQAFGIDPSFLEAMAFAWFAQQTLQKRPIDLRRITGARKPAILGGVYF